MTRSPLMPLDKARANAWFVAKRVTGLADAQRAAEIDVLDSWVAILGNVIRHPIGFITNAIIATVRARETNNVKKVIDVLSQA